MLDWEIAMNSRHQWRLTITAAIAAGLLSGAAQGAPTVPNPIVMGPIAATAPPGDPSHDYPFFAATADLASRGYVEAEYFFEGSAKTYNINVTVPKLDTAVVTGSGYPYRTRMVVRRPLSLKDFNGTVILEWQNDTAGNNLDAIWLQSSEHIMRSGYAWIGVSAQRAGVHAASSGLRAWSPLRYGTLDVTAGNTVPTDALSWDIFSQAAQAIRSPQGVDPMGGLPVQQVLAVGASQAAARLVYYHNAIHPLAGVIDAFGLFVGGGMLRTDLDVKAMKILSETDVVGSASAKSQAFIRQPDSNQFRRWEIAGTAHLDHQLVQGLNPLQVRDGLSVTSGAACTYPAFSRIPLYHVAAAAYDHMVRWVQYKVPPPQAPDIELATLAEQVSPPVRDSYGNALGGIQLSQHAVPTATNSGQNFPDAPLPAYCRLYGTHVPFDAATLGELYRNHGSYVSRVAQATMESLKGGFIVEADARATIVDAAHAATGRPQAGP
jgi:Alpha/beta hydrolase domain